MWAFACISFYFLAGRPPFKEPTDYLIFQKIQKGEYTFPEGFDPTGRDLIEKLLVSPFLPNLDLAVHLIGVSQSGKRPDEATDRTRHQKPPVLRAYH
jgi:serine/threonine protein kinase